MSKYHYLKKKKSMVDHEKNDMICELAVWRNSLITLGSSLLLFWTNSASNHSQSTVSSFIPFYFSVQVHLFPHK